MSVERELRLASEHMREAARAMGETPLHAEQRDKPLSEGYQVGSLKATVDGATGRSHIEWQPEDDGPQINDVRRTFGLPEFDPTAIPLEEMRTSREMTPNEIREVELKGLAERIGLIGQYIGLDSYRQEVERIIDGRIKALHPQQTSEEAFEKLAKGRRDPGMIHPDLFKEMDKKLQDQATKLGFNQKVEDGIRVEPNSAGIPTFHGGRLVIKIELAAGTRAYSIPPYQVEQLEAIADGRASRPGSPIPQPDSFDVEPLLEWLAEQVGEILSKR